MESEIDDASAAGPGALRDLQRTAASLSRAAEEPSDYTERLRRLAEQVWAMADEMRSVEASIAGIGGSLRVHPTTAGPMAVVGEHVPRAERIVQILRKGRGPMGLNGIVDALHDSGDETATVQVVMNALTRLVQRGWVARTDRGRYVA